MFQEAVEFATKAHEGQVRKGTRKPYIVHPIEVAEIVRTMTSDEEVLCAAVLHDTIEDCTGVTEDILRSRFGERVAAMIALADKLSNMRDIDRDYPVLGEGLWMKFRMHSKQAIGWYYKGVMEALQEDFQEVPAFQEYCRLVRKHFGDAPASLEWKEEKKRRGAK